MTKHTQKGFTLIELSIVLVIIGLIVGGVLVGQEMIRGAEVRAVISQFERYNAAINTFRNKYAGLPGDLSTADNFFDYAVAGTTRNGDGNGIIADAAGSAADPGNFDVVDDVDGNELTQFWPMLSGSNLVDGTFVHALGTNILGSGNNFPVTRFNRGGIMAINIAGRNTFHIGLGSVGAANAPVFSDVSSVTPNEAFQIDSKMDDGRPNRGTVLGAGGTTAALIAVAPTPAATACLAAVDTYNVQTSNGVQDSTICQMQLRMM